MRIDVGIGVGTGVGMSVDVGMATDGENGRRPHGRAGIGTSMGVGFMLT